MRSGEPGGYAAAMKPEALVYIVGGLIGAAIGAAIGARKNRTGFGLLIGFIAGPIGWLIVLLLPSNFPKCPACKGDVIPGAVQELRFRLASPGEVNGVP
jgi:hypothetical protein